MLDKENYTRRVFNKEDGVRTVSLRFRGGWVTAALIIGKWDQVILLTRRI